MALLKISDPSVAAELIWAAHDAGSRLGRGLERVRDRVDPGEFSAITLAIGQVLGGELLDLRQGLADQHPQFGGDDLEAFFGSLKAAGVEIDNEAARLGKVGAA